MEWTKPQSEAITYNENKNILVAAAAGSGKTAVLVERIIQKILDPNKPISVSDVLVLTFTESAAKEMKNKIASAIDKKLKEFPNNKHLKAQALRISSADISTIHSYAKKILDNNIHLTNLPAGFSIIDEAENKFMLDETLDDCLERYYSRLDKLPSFAELTIGYGGIKNDTNLRDAILSLYYFSRSMAQPKKWLKNVVSSYKTVSDSSSIIGTVWEKYYMECIHNEFRHILEYYNTIINILKEEFCDEDSVFNFYVEEKAMLENIFHSQNLSEYFDAKERLVFKRRSTPRKLDDYQKELLSLAADLRKAAKNALDSFSLFAFDSEEQASNIIAKLYPRIKTLKNIILMLMRRHKRNKLLNSYLDFDDLEHELIGLIMNHDGTPTKFCHTLGSKYSEIFVDEYQDTNNIQDTLFRLLSGGRGNIFMVGDIKQSIYKFRNASPKLFLDKYRSYEDTQNTEGHLIRLSNNFRSRNTVVDSVNFVFRQLMKRDSAEIDYNENEYLYQSIPYPMADNESCYGTEMLMTNVLTKSTISNRTATASNKRELEAETVAKKILDLIYKEKLNVTDKKTGLLRPVEFGDIVILCRSIKSASPAFESVFNRYGIPLSGSLNDNFLNTTEVSIVINFLQIIDNPLQDIPLIAVMRSPIFGFTPDELAKIRVSQSRGAFFNAVKTSAEQGNTNASEFLDTLNELRRKSKYLGVDELIYSIYHDFNYLSIVGGMTGGEIRLSNLKTLFEYAVNFEKTALKGLFNFVGYLEKISESTPSSSGGDAIGGGEAVTITTVHKSKGLEYPVVILANTATSLSDRSTFYVNEEIGVGMSYVDINTRIKYKSPTAEIISFKNNKETFAEEMRLLYVAMTRAKEKLIISCTNEGMSKQWLSAVYTKDGVCPAYIESGCVFRDWLVYAFAKHPKADALREFLNSDTSVVELDNSCKYFKFSYVDPLNELEAETEIKDTDADKDEPSNQVEKDYKKLKNTDLLNTETTSEWDNASIDEMKKILEYSYPNAELTTIPLKLSVTEIKRSLQQDLSEADGEYTPRQTSIADRSFNSPKISAAAEIGTITHFVMQQLNPEYTNSNDEIKNQVSKMIATNVITLAQADEVDINSLYEFYSTDIGSRIRSAYKIGKLYREYKFLIPIKAKEVYRHLSDTKDGDAEIIVQGIADCFFIENDKIILVDYKTDNVSHLKATQKAEEYKIQLEFYAKGLEMIFNKPVCEKILYFMKPHTAVKI